MTSLAHLTSLIHYILRFRAYQTLSIRYLFTFVSNLVLFTFISFVVVLFSRSFFSSFRPESKNYIVLSILVFFLCIFNVFCCRDSSPYLFTIFVILFPYLYMFISLSGFFGRIVSLLFSAVIHVIRLFSSFVSLHAYILFVRLCVCVV